MLGGEAESSFFEFLYPAQTLAFIRQFASCSLDGRWRRQTSKRGVRTYTSQASETKEESQQEDQAVAGPSSAEYEGVQVFDSGLQDASTDIEYLQTLTEILKSGVRRDYEDAWRRFRKLEPIEKEGTSIHITNALLEYLSTSPRTVEAERMIELFSQLKVEHRDAPQYRTAIRAYLRLSNLKKAVETHEEALSRVTGNLGTGTLLASAIAWENWDLAFRTWDGYERQIDRSVEQPGIWDEVDVLSNLADRALSLAEYAEQNTEASQDTLDLDSHVTLGDFVNSVMFRALEFKYEDITRDDIYQLFDRLRRSRLLTAAEYENAIFRLLSLNRGKYASSLYQEFRKEEALQPPGAKILYALLGNYCRFDSVRGIQMVLDDLFTNHEGPDWKGYHVALGKLATLGDATSVHKLFAAFMSKYEKPTSIRTLRPLLLVHSRRAEVNETVRHFKAMSEQFGFTPDLPSWNILLSVYARVNDVDGAFRCFNDLLDNGMKPDRYTYGTLMGLCARRGDIASLQELLRRADSTDITRSVEAVDSLVLASINNDELEDAERYVEAALTMDLTGSRTRMWNYLLNAHALRRNIDAVMRIHQRMQSAGVPLDSMTYSALMQSLAILKETESAYKILRVVMPRDGIKVTAFHYAIVMGGYLASNEPESVFGVYKRMIKRNIRPTLSTQLPLLKASASAELNEIRRHGLSEATQELTQTEELLEEALANIDPMDLASREPVRGISKQPVDDAYLAAPFEFLIFIYGQQGLFEKVKLLYDKYIDTANERNLKNKIVPTSKMLSALMVSHLRQQQYDGVFKCWTLARSSAERIAKRLTAADLSKPGWVLPSQRYILATPLIYLMKSLGEQEDLQGITSTIAELQSDGYDLDARNWNLYVQLLVRNGLPFEAFQQCEQRLMDGWKGWPFQQRQQGISKADARPVKANSHHVQPWILSPNYRTLVYLASAIMDIQTAESASLSLRGRGSESEQIDKLAPRAMEAVRNMPRMDDNLQTDLLRRW
ncbi:MAG: hypothetical protein M1830_000551 [Pleopsidium flavum]|nr:MAG: hypothetical protein M1830_000551 [Pleopsidium flavum]